MGLKVDDVSDQISGVGTEHITGTMKIIYGMN